MISSELCGPVDEESDNFRDECKVAEISFAFNNAKLIQLLRKRGQTIINDQDEKTEEINNDIMKLRAEHMESLIIPITAFITMNTEIGYQRACKLEYKKTLLREKTKHH
jgi:hypothetical protein